MNVNKKLFLNLMLLFMLFLFTVPAYADVVLKSGSSDLAYDDEETIDFTLPSDGCADVIFYNTSTDYYLNLEGSLKRNPLKSEDDFWDSYDYDDDADIPDFANDQDYQEIDCGIEVFYFTSDVDRAIDGAHFYSNGVLQGGASYTFTVTNKNEEDVPSVRWEVRFAPQYSSSVKIARKSVKLSPWSTTSYPITISPIGSISMLSVSTSKKNICNPVLKNNKLKLESGEPGDCTVQLKLANGYKHTIKVHVKNPSKPVFEESKVTLYKGETWTNKLYTSKKVKWSTSNKKIATVSSSGKVKALRNGKCMITGKVGKKKYSYTLKVVQQDPDFEAYLDEYYTRDNYFTVKFKNLSNKTLTIISGSKVINQDYKTFDRSVRLKKKVVIKPGKSATVKFFVKGRTTWYDVSDYTLYYKFSFDGKNWEGHVWDEDSVYKVGKKWYNTYLESDDEE